MKMSIKKLIIFFVTAIFFSCSNPYIAHPIVIPFPSAPWDCVKLNEVTIDSSTSPYTITVFDTSFASHSQHSYMGFPNDSLVYVDYTVTPNTVTSGHYNFIYVDSILVTSFPSAGIDTFAYKLALTGDTISLAQTTNNSLKVSQTFTEFYTRR
jgi:hypothetical protein